MPDRYRGTAEARIGERILDVEWRRRDPCEPPRDLLAAVEGLPPVSVLADRAFPRWVLDRRLRFLRTVGWDGGVPSTLSSFTDLPPALAIPEDLVALVAAAERVSTGDPFLAALARSLGRPCRGPEQPPDAALRIAERLDSLAGRRAGTGAGWEVPPARSRLEAVTVHADRRFGRAAMRGGWDGLHALVGAAGRAKRSVRP